MLGISYQCMYIRNHQTNRSICCGNEESLYSLALVLVSEKYFEQTRHSQKVLLLSMVNHTCMHKYSKKSIVNFLFLPLLHAVNNTSV